MRRVRSVVVVAACAVALTACGGDEIPNPAEVVEGVRGDLADAIPPVAAVDNSFAPDGFSAPAGQEVTVSVVNTGQNPHTFTIDSLGVDTGVLDAGQTGEVSFTMPDQAVEFVCTVHGADVMSGTISPT